MPISESVREHFHVDWLISNLRWLLLVSVALVIFLDTFTTSGEFFDTASILPQIVLLTVATLYNLLIMLLLLSGILPRAIPVTTLLVDTVLTIGFVIVSGGLASPLLFFALFPILTAALRFPWVVSLLVALAIVASCGFAGYAVAPPGTPLLELLSFAVKSFILVLAALLSGLVGTQIKQIIARTRQLEEEAGLRKLRAAQEHSRVIFELATMLSATLNYSKILTAVLEVGEAGMRELGRPNSAHVSMVMLFGRNDLRIVASRHLPRRDQDTVFQSKSGALAQALATAEAVITNDPATDPELGQLIMMHSCEQAIVVPLRAGSENFGAVVFGSPQPNTYTQDHQELLNAICNQAIVALQNAQLYQSLVEEREAYEKGMTLLTRALLTTTSTAGNLEDIAALAERPEFVAASIGSPRWRALVHLQRASLEIRTMRESTARTIRSQALNRALGELTILLEHAGEIPEPEWNLVQEIAARWREVLLAVAGEVGQVAIAEPVTNPYVVGDPVVGAGFVGREDIVRLLEELWAGSEVPPSVVLFGHRRMGKTSILRNLPGHLGASVHLAYVNLLLVGDAPGGAGEVLLALADGAARALRETGRAVREPEPAVFQAHAYRAFEQYLRAVREALGEERLILAVDEFEQLEEWMAESRLPHDFLKVLRGYVQMEPAIAFTFAGLHTLEEMTADYFEPFFASVIPVKVGFLSRGAVSQLLANPSEDFALDYDSEALERVWHLTAGQPYLAQLIGHRLVSRFNDLTFERGQKPEPRFTAEDMEAVVGDPEFYQMGRYYFTGVWGQARQDPPEQQAVLRALADHPEGRTWEELVADTGLAEGALGAAVAALERHDVVVKGAGRWQYAVELMRRWVAREQE